MSGIPLALDGVTMPPSPEAAVEYAARQTATQIVEIPVLGVPGNRVSQTFARWRLRLERPVELERVVDGKRLVTADVYVGTVTSIDDAGLAGAPVAKGPGLRLLAADEKQPTSEQILGVEIPLRPGYEVEPARSAGRPVTSGASEADRTRRPRNRRCRRQASL